MCPIDALIPYASSTVATDVERVLGGVEPHLMVTDPPYGVEYDPAWRNEAKFSDADPVCQKWLFELEFGNAWYSAGAIRRIYPDRVFISAAWSGSEGW